MPIADEDRDEAALVSQFGHNVEVPEDLVEEFERWQLDRAYVHSLDESADTPDAVVTNYILSAQQTLVANIMPEDPRPRIQVAEWIPEQESTDPAIQQLALADGDPTNIYPPEWLNYVKAQEIIVAKQQRMAGFEGVLRGMIQDGLTLPISWVKLRWVDDYSRDPIGFLQDDEFSVMLRHYRSLKEAWDEKVFPEDDPRHAEMQDFNRQIKDRLIEGMTEQLAEVPPEPQTDVFGEAIGPDPRVLELGELQSDKLIDPDEVPDVPHYQGFLLEGLDPEDIRYDWRITRPEDIRFAWWMAHRVFLAPSEIDTRWNLSEEDAAELRQNAKVFDEEGGALPDDRKADEDERARGEAEEPTRGQFFAVWEYWDRRTHMVYRWVQGDKKFLDKFRVEGGSRRFFPFYALVLNRVTGKMHGPSHARMLTPLQEELNMLRTHDREARKSAYPRYMVTKGLLNKRAKAEMRMAVPYSVIEVEKANEVSQNIFPLVPAPYAPALYDGSRARQDFEATAGLSSSSLGVTSGAEFATSDAIANQQLGVRVRAQRAELMRILADIYEAMIQINAQRLSAENAMQLAGPGTVWLGSSLEREQILNNFLIEVEASPSGAAERQSELTRWNTAAGIIAQLGLPLNRIALSKEILRLMGIRTNLSQFLDLNLLLAPPAPMQGGGTTPPGAAPEDQGGEGAGGGRPPTEESDEITPESVPNRPQASVQA